MEKTKLRHLVFLYHIVFIPKYRKKSIFGRLRKEIGVIFHELCRQFEIGLIEGHAQPDHIHMCLSIPPKYGVAQALGRLKGKSAILIHCRYLGKSKNLTGYHFWARGYCIAQLASMKRLFASISEIRKHMSNNWNNTYCL